MLCVWYCILAWFCLKQGHYLLLPSGIHSKFSNQFNPRMTHMFFFTIVPRIQSKRRGSIWLYIVFFQFFSSKFSQSATQRHERDLHLHSLSVSPLPSFAAPARATRAMWSVLILSMLPFTYKDLEGSAMFTLCTTQLVHPFFGVGTMGMSEMSYRHDCTHSQSSGLLTSLAAFTTSSCSGYYALYPSV